MSEFKFDKMKNLDIPDEWAENTITSISKSDNSKEKHIPYSRYVISFASLVFVVVISVVVFMMTNNDLFLSQTKDETVSVKQTEISTKNQSNVETSAPTQMQTESPTEECKEETDLTENDNEYTENDYPDEYEDPDESGSQNNDSSGNSNPGDSIQQGGSSNALKPNKSEYPFKNPHYASARPSGSSNSDPSSKPNSSVSSEYIVVPDYDTDKPAEEKGIHTFLSVNDMPLDNRNLYCKILTKEDETLLGNPDLYADERIVDVYKTDEKFAYISFCAGKNGGVIQNGEYKLYIYDDEGFYYRIIKMKIRWFDE